MKLIKKYKSDIFNLGLLTFSLPVFFFKLGASSLNDWDEAWYADIARNILKNKDLLHLTWNGRPYLDHPPFGFWLEALTFKIFGINEFWARFPQALAGLLCLYLTYLIGKEMVNRFVGLVSAIALTSTFWFIERARSGNLDILLTLFFLLTFYLSLKAANNIKYYLPLTLSLIGLFLTKTLVPLAIIPALFFLLWKKIKLYNIKKYLILFLLFTGGWFIFQIFNYPQFALTLKSVGLRGVNLNSSYLLNIKLIKDYLHFGIGKWFWPGILGLILTLILKQKILLYLSIFVITFLLPFSFSPKVQIWHLIPVYPFLLLLFFGATFCFLEKYFAKYKYLAFSVIVLISLWFYIRQIRQVWFNIVDQPKYISDIAILSKAASGYKNQLLTDVDFDPTAVFYSQKNVRKIKPDEINTIFKSKESFLLITNDWRLNNAKIGSKSYILLRTDRDKVLVLHE